MVFLKQYSTALIALIVGLGAIGWYIFNDLSSSNDQGDSNGVPTSTSTQREVGGIGFEGDGDFIVEQVSSADAGTPPELDRPITIPAVFPPDAARQMREVMGKIIADLKADTLNVSLWLELGLRRQEINDYVGAGEVFEYVTRLAPKDSTAFNNLGNLYHLYLKDFARSEQYFLKAIELEPTQAIYYNNLYDLYRYSYKRETTAAADILKRGIKEMPERIDLYVALGAYYEDKQDRKQAKVYYEQALDLAIAQGNTALREAIGKELAEL